MGRPMPKKLPRSAYYSIRAPENFYRDMREDVELLREHQRFSACLTVVWSCIDALAAGSGSGGALVAINQERLIAQFLTVVSSLERERARGCVRP
jgi:pyrroline-5-carboxylate reductase